MSHRVITLIYPGCWRWLSSEIKTSCQGQISFIQKKNEKICLVFSIAFISWNIQYYKNTRKLNKKIYHICSLEEKCFFFFAVAISEALLNIKTSERYSCWECACEECLTGEKRNVLLRRSKGILKWTKFTYPLLFVILFEIFRYSFRQVDFKLGLQSSDAYCI